MRYRVKFEVGSVIWAVVLLIGLSACGAAPAAQVESAPAAATTAPPTAAVAPSPTIALTDAPTAAPAATAAPTQAPTTATPEPVAATISVFQIDPAQSQASFSLDEELFGSPVNVIGLTSDVSGQISVTQGNLSQTTIGPIRINARDLHTDEEMRNRAIRTFILQSSEDAYQYITFEPTQIEGLPSEAKTGESVTFKVTGNLRIRDIVKPVTFEMTVTAKSETELSGTGNALVKRSDFGLTIPSVPGIANVSDDVSLEFAFVATKQ